jgi:hypothetical protein
MLTRYVEKNKFGGYTWTIRLTPLNVIYLNETNTDVYIVDYKEIGFFGGKTRFSFVSNNNLEQVISESFDKLYEYYLKSKDYLYTESQRDYQCNQVLEILKRFREKLKSNPDKSS